VTASLTLPEKPDVTTQQSAVRIRLFIRFCWLWPTSAATRERLQADFQPWSECHSLQSCEQVTNDTCCGLREVWVVLSHSPIPQAQPRTTPRSQSDAPGWVAVRWEQAAIFCTPTYIDDASHDDDAQGSRCVALFYVIVYSPHITQLRCHSPLRQHRISVRCRPSARSRGA
jgi:hypothetical protein